MIWTENEVSTLKRLRGEGRAAVKRFCEIVQFSIPQKEEFRLELLRG